MSVELDVVPSVTSSKRKLSNEQDNGDINLPQKRNSSSSLQEDKSIIDIIVEEKISTTDHTKVIFFDIETIWMNLIGISKTQRERALNNAFITCVCAQVLDEVTGEVNRYQFLRNGTMVKGQPKISDLKEDLKMWAEIKSLFSIARILVGFNAINFDLLILRKHVDQATYKEWENKLYDPRKNLNYVKYTRLEDLAEFGKKGNENSKFVFFILL